MAKIRQLSAEVANLIAAGEVIERPTSVVKELVENAIDAGATEITVTLLDAGLKEIAVLDNGSGMSQEDMYLALKPHATSKITGADDLFTIATLGFRGEALPAIAAVSRLTLKSSLGDGPGLMFTVQEGAVVSEALIAMPRGTEVIVRALFHGLPARHAQLARPSQEIAKISEYVFALALARPNIAFRLVNNDREIFASSGDGNLLGVIAAGYGADVAGRMVQFRGSNAGYDISGFTTKNDVTRSSSDHIYFIINGRAVYNKALYKAVMTAFDGFIVSGKYPICVIDIKSDLGAVDVNVHPAKKEVRFQEEALLTALITDVFGKVLSSASLAIKAPVAQPPEKAADAESLFTDQAEPARIAREDPTVYEYQAPPVEAEAASFTQEQLPLSAAEAEKTELAGLEYIGQLFGTYLLAQKAGFFYVIDQHAAFERLQYEAVLETIDKEGVAIQPLLVSYSLEFSPQEAALIKANLGVIYKAGVELEELGPKSFVVRGVPDFASKDTGRDFVEEIITAVITGKNTSKKALFQELCKTIACKSSPTGNTYLAPEAVRELFRRLAQAKMPYTCAHGRPTIVKFTENELAQWFRRIV